MLSNAKSTRRAAWQAGRQSETSSPLCKLFQVSWTCCVSVVLSPRSWLSSRQDPDGAAPVLSCPVSVSCAVMAAHREKHWYEDTGGWLQASWYLNQASTGRDPVAACGVPTTMFARYIHAVPSFNMLCVLCALLCVVDVPKSAEAIYNKMRQQWLKLKARSNEVRVAAHASCVCIEPGHCGAAGRHVFFARLEPALWLVQWGRSHYSATQSRQPCMRRGKVCVGCTAQHLMRARLCPHRRFQAGFHKLSPAPLLCTSLT